MILGILLLLLCFGYEKMGSETLPLRAYYPSPVGIYTRLVSINKATFAREKGVPTGPGGVYGMVSTDGITKSDILVTASFEPSKCGSVTFPVRKGEYWKILVSRTDFLYVYWIPML